MCLKPNFYVPVASDYEKPVLRIRIRNPGSSVFLTTGSEIRDG